MYLLDTDIIIWILRGNNNVVDRIKTIVKDNQITVSVLTVAEVYQHIFPKELDHAERLFSSYVLFPVDARIARNGGFYWQELHKKLKTLSIVDCLIAATAKEHDAILLTLNTRHFPMKDIRVRDPLKIQN